MKKTLKKVLNKTEKVILQFNYSKGATLSSQPNPLNGWAQICFYS